MSRESLIATPDGNETPEEKIEKEDEIDYGAILEKVLSPLYPPPQRTTLGDWINGPKSSPSNVGSTSTVIEDKKFLNGETMERESRVKRRHERRTGRRAPLFPKSG